MTDQGAWLGSHAQAFGQADPAHAACEAWRHFRLAQSNPFRLGSPRLRSSLEYFSTRRSVAEARLARKVAPVDPHGVAIESVEIFETGVASLYAAYASATGTTLNKRQASSEVKLAY